jgi:xanthine dehydrogenase accessory factor
MTMHFSAQMTGLPRTWFDALAMCQQQGRSYVLLTLLATAGSTPRNSGTKMLVCDDSQFDTIGGGNLEFMAVQRARELLLSALCDEQQPSLSNIQHIENFPLSSKLGQCCGGATNVLFEVFVQHCQHLVIFGAGHVAQALVPIVSQMPLQLLWLDEREALFDQFHSEHNNIANLKAITTDNALENAAHDVASLPANAWLVIMTHHHQLDYALVKAALLRPDLPYVGMIGSNTKARRFCTRLKHEGLSVEQINKLVSPIGLLDVPGKEPINVAVSIAAQLMQNLHNKQTNKQTTASQQKQQWQQNQQLIASLRTQA